MSKKFKKPKPLLVDRTGETLVEDKSEEQRPFRVGIAVPCRDEVKTSFMVDLIALVGFTSLAGVAAGKLELAFLYQKGTLIASQRHGLVIEAMKKQCDAILWLDADMRFPKETLFRLMAHGEKLVGCNYSTRAGKPAHPVAFKNMRLDHPLAYDYVFTGPESTGLEEVDSVGMGVFFTHIDVFLSMKPPAFFIPWNAEYGGGYEGEDVFFCRKARAAGHKVYIDHDLSKDVRHCGEHEYDNVLDAFLDKEEAEAKKQERYENWLEVNNIVVPEDPDGTDDSGESDLSGPVVVRPD